VLPTHRGLDWTQMPGRTGPIRKMQFAQFKRGLWPAKNLHIDESLTGEDFLTEYRRRLNIMNGKK